MVGLWRDPGLRVNAFLMAFGGGTLLFALSLELFGEALHHQQTTNKGILVGVMTPCAVIGGLAFVLLNRMISRWGSFKRTLFFPFVG